MCSWSQVQELLYLFAVQFFASLENERLADTLRSKLVDQDHFTEGDEAHQCVLWDQRQGHLQGFLKMQSVSRY